MDRVAGTTVLTGRVIDQVHCMGSSSGPWSWAWSSISIGPADDSIQTAGDEAR